MIKVVRDPQGNRHEIVLDDDLVWLLPYLMASRKFGVPVWRIREIKGYYVPEGKAEAQAAQTILHAGTSRYVITILKFHQSIMGDGETLRVTGYLEASEGFMFEGTLQTLAHELAHLVHWEHTPDRFVLETRILAGYARLAKRLGYRGYEG